MAGIKFYEDHGGWWRTHSGGAAIDTLANYTEQKANREFPEREPKGPVLIGYCARNFPGIPVEWQADRICGLTDGQEE